MIKFLRTIFLVAFLFTLLGVAEAGQVDSTFTGVDTNSIIVGNVSVTKVEIVNATAGTATFTLYDAPAAITGGLTYSVGAFTNYNIATALVTNTWTNIFGVSNSEVSTKITKTETSTAASTPTYNKIRSTISIPANSTSTVTFPNFTLTTFGVGGVSSTNLVATVYYTPN